LEEHFLHKNIMTNKDISNIENIQLMVDTFYSNIRKDELLGPIFDEKIGDRWSEHLEKMYRFWQTILLEEHTYSGSPFPPHKQLPVEKQHFNRWMEIFSSTVDSLFTGPLAEEAKLRGQNMAEMFNHKIEYFRHEAKHLLL
jgi:hemoglobin